MALPFLFTVKGIIEQARALGLKGTAKGVITVWCGAFIALTGLLLPAAFQAWFFGVGLVSCAAGVCIIVLRRD
jgi:hypothetical protein